MTTTAAVRLGAGEPVILEKFHARSWLFVPGDSERKMEKAVSSPADVVLLDLEDAIAEAEKVSARSRVAAFLSAHQTQRSRLWVRINPLSGSYALADLAAVLRGGAGGIMLPKCRSRADVEALDRYLSALEVSFGISPGSTQVISLVAESAEGIFSMGSYAGAPRLTAMTWGIEDLASTVSAGETRNADGSLTFTYELVRSLCLLGAAAAGVAAIETVSADFRDEVRLRKRVQEARRAGFCGMLAIHPVQVDVINEAFLPTSEELTAARAVVDLFAANPGAGAIGYMGTMVDRPHLARAQALLRAVARPHDEGVRQANDPPLC